ncbi:kinase-like domain-containing protein [Xylaria sp. FL0064]|nr:kinase-like domain-containing protein [Xylaria sp. FL0064]
MADTDLIACVYPYRDSEFGYARKAIEDSPRYMPPKLLPQVPPVTRKIRGARESTEPLENRDDDNNVNPDTLPYIELRSSDGLRTLSGFVFGKDPETSDIVLPSIGHISRRHFALTYKNKFDDGYRRLIMRDLGSTRRTIVTYANKGRELRSKFDWIIDGSDVLYRTDEFIIEPYEDLKFRVIVTRHDITSPPYVDNVERFRQGAAGAEDLFGPILLLQGWIAQGIFGAVSCYRDVSTGKEYARKQPIGKTYDRNAWEKEIDIMKSISHEHIVRFCFSNKAPRPLMYLEYMPFGNLEDEHKRAHFSQDECLVIFYQSLSALAYLHGRSKPVAHRDLKPENILVQYRNVDQNPDYLHVKLSDFGLSNANVCAIYAKRVTQQVERNSVAPVDIDPIDPDWIDAVDSNFIDPKLLRYNCWI